MWIQVLHCMNITVYIYNMCVYICIFNAHAYTVAKPMTQTTASI